MPKFYPNKISPKADRETQKIESEISKFFDTQNEKVKANAHKIKEFEDYQPDISLIGKFRKVNDKGKTKADYFQPVKDFIKIE